MFVECESNACYNMHVYTRSSISNELQFLLENQVDALLQQLLIRFEFVVHLHVHFNAFVTTIPSLSLHVLGLT